jgi:hypothetical protein
MQVGIYPPHCALDNIVQVARYYAIAANFDAPLNHRTDAQDENFEFVDVGRQLFAHVQT